jgi:hypothetical protein
VQYKPKKEYYGEEKHEEKKSSYGYKKEETVRTMLWISISVHVSWR